MKTNFTHRERKSRFETGSAKAADGAVDSDGQRKLVTEQSSPRRANSNENAEGNRLA